MLQLPDKIRIGTRSSALALAQVELTKARLREIFPELAENQLETVPMITSGDRNPAETLVDVGGKGLFTKEIEEALMEGTVDIAVHSFKDMPAFLPNHLIIAGVLERADPRDALVTTQASSLATLPANATIGTSSPRRHAQILMERPDLNVIPLRGNVPTRLQKLMDGKADATILAMAGLKRLNIKDAAITPISTEEMLPAVAQGAIALECREDNEIISAIIRAISHLPTLTCTLAERSMLAVLDGSCRTPIAGFGEIIGDQLRLRGLVMLPDGSAHVKAEHTGSQRDAIQIGKELGEELKRNAPAGMLNG